MLFLPPHAPLQLPDQGSVLLGRSSEAQLRLHDADSSRQHARIVCAGGRWVLHDLDSTNGTWVNGKRIQSHELRPGDRIEVGNNEIAFCQVDADLETGDDSASTVA